jgi:hypothetical protein
MISFGLVDGRPVFMDSRTDSYFMLDAAAEASFLAASAGKRRMEPDGTEVPFCIADECSILVHAACPRATRSVFDRAERGARAIEIAQLTQLLLSIRRSLARKPIHLILSHLSDHRWKSGVGSHMIADRALLFAAVRRLVPIAPNCLLDSLALTRWLGPAAESTMLVFGAKLEPFAAHCWVQADDLLLNDRPESVARFCPVRVVRCSRATL